MSDHSNFSVLLPRATVALFVMDSDIRTIASALSSDWRFARVTFEIHEGNVDSAMEYYKDKASPELVIVETATVDDSFPPKLETFAGYCSENTSAVVVGPVNDVYLYRKLIDMGVTDYLVRPLKQDILADVIGKALLAKFGAADSHVIAYIGAKGGVGTSTLAQLSAKIISIQLQHKTVMIDAGGGSSYLTVAMGLEPMTTLFEAARAAQSTDQDSFKRLLSSVNDKLTILASGADGFLDDSVSADAFDAILNRIVPVSPVVIVDLSSTSSAVRRQVLARANEVIIVTTPTLPSLRAARLLLQESKTVRGGSDKDIAIVLNRVGEAAGIEIQKGDIESALEQKVSASFNFDSKLFTTLETTDKKLTDIKGHENVIANLIAIAKLTLKSGDVPTPADKKADAGLMARLFGSSRGGS